MVSYNENIQITCVVCYLYAEINKRMLDVVYMNIGLTMCFDNYTRDNLYKFIKRRNVPLFSRKILLILGINIKIKGYINDVNYVNM